MSQETDLVIKMFLTILQTIFLSEMMFSTTLEESRNMNLVFFSEFFANVYMSLVKGKSTKMKLDNSVGIQNSLVDLSRK